MRKIGAPGVTRTPDSQFRKLLSVVEVLDTSTAASGLAGPRRAWTAAAASETDGRSAVANVRYQSVRLQYQELMGGVPSRGENKKWRILPVGEVNDQRAACQGGYRRNAPRRLRGL